MFFPDHKFLDMAMHQNDIKYNIFQHTCINVNKTEKSVALHFLFTLHQTTNDWYSFERFTEL